MVDLFCFVHQLNVSFVSLWHQQWLQCEFSQTLKGHCSTCFVSFVSLWCQQWLHLQCEFGKTLKGHCSTSFVSFWCHQWLQCKFHRSKTLNGHCSTCFHVRLELSSQTPPWWQYWLNGESVFFSFFYCRYHKPVLLKFCGTSLYQLIQI